MLLKYRPDIDGLRSIAVVAVVLFHARVPGLDGGYVGVDIFFVISGFLITSIISKEIIQEKFSFIRFYERRMRRLIPALIPVLIFAVGFTTIYYDAETYLRFSKSVFAFVGLGSNWLFLSEAGYFDTLAEAKPLLHTWSLSIEEQYYLLFPAFLVFTFTKSKRLSLWLVGLIFLVSLSLSVFWVENGYLDTAYYNSFGRIWELMLGSILALLQPVLKPSSRVSAGLGFAGLLMIGISVFLFDTQTPFPGLMGMIPVFGTAAIIAASNPSGPVQRMLALPPLVYVGRVSYSFYLWHWVVISYILVLWPGAEYQQLLWGVAASFVLSVLSYHFVETPFRKRTMLPTTKQIYALFAGFVIVFMGISSVGIVTGGLPERIAFFGGQTKSELLEQLQEARQSRQVAIRQGVCNFAKTTIEEFFPAAQSCYDLSEKFPDILVVGDSHAADLYVALSRNYPDINFIQVTGAGCGIGDLPRLDGQSGGQLSADKNLCRLFFSRALNSELLKNVDGVILTSRFSEENFTGEAATNLVNFFRQNGSEVPITVFGPTREFQPTIKAYIRSSSDLAATRSGLNYQLQQGLVRGAAPDISGFVGTLDALGARYVDKNQFICPQDVCTFYNDDGYPVFPDYGHWTAPGAKLIGGRIADRFPDIFDVFEGE